VEWWQELIRDSVLLLMGGGIAYVTGMRTAAGQRQHEIELKKRESAEQVERDRAARLREHWKVRLQETRASVARVIDGLEAQAYGKAYVMPPGEGLLGSLGLLGDDDAVREFDAVVVMLARQAGRGLSQEQAMRVVRLQTRMMALLNAQDKRVVNDQEPKFTTRGLLSSLEGHEALYLSQHGQQATREGGPASESAQDGPSTPGPADSADGG
jgi:hypothetical protein